VSTLQHTRTDGSDIRSLPEILRADSIDGYLYVVGFSNGIVKVGKTGNPRGRIGSHRDGAERFGVHIEDLWLSVPHRNYSVNERSLIALMGESRHGAEYFDCKSFEAAVEIAERELDFQVLTAEQKSELIAAQEEGVRHASQTFVAALKGGNPTHIAIREDVQAWILQLLYGHGVELPKIRESADVDGIADLIEELSEKSGHTVEEISGWSYLDFVEYIARTQTDTALMNLRTRALRAERSDLLTPGRFAGGAS
jgi:hypothetical protein